MLVPLRNTVLIERVEADKKTESGIILTTFETDKNYRGKILSVGPGEDRLGTFVKPSVSVGDLVVFDAAVSKEVTDKGKKFYIVEDRDVVCKLTES